MRNNGHVQLTGTSSVMIELRQEIERIARSDAKVLITGESGVGKELVAHAVHAQSPRGHRPFVAVNCAGLPETLLESELFGHVKGSFTGAYRDKPGKLELADDGTIFLDEIGEMTLRMQGLLLRFLETGELQKVGADRTGGRVNVRVIAATNRNLRDMVGAGHVPRGSVLSAERHPPHRAAAARAPRGHPGADPLLPGAVHAEQRLPGQGAVAGRDEAADRVLVARQRARARERHRALRRDRPQRSRRVDDLPIDVRVQHSVGLRPKRERRRTVADDLFKR